MKDSPGVGFEPGQGEERDSGKCSSPIAPPGPDQQPVDPRAAILLRAAARYDLLRAGEIDLAQAFDSHFVADFLEATGACPCRSAIVSSPRPRKARECPRPLMIGAFQKAPAASRYSSNPPRFVARGRAPCQLRAVFSGPFLVSA
jgi:hypothetical protein